MRMGDGVRLEVDSEDVIIETEWLEWKDKPRTLFAGEDNEVFIYQEKGTVFTGIGFHANARLRTWEFSGGAGGTYIHEDDEEEVAAEDDDVSAENTGIVVEEGE